jgi:transforming growth factor-beta-induced protein
VGLDATLGDESTTFTVFAPEDASFAPYDVDYLLNDPTLLEEVLGFHVVQGAAVFAGDLSDGDTFTTVQGDEIEIAISDGTVFVEGAAVTTADVEASNGVAHLIDDVLLTNRTAVERATVTNNFSILADLVGEANLADALSGPGPDGEDGITVFAPTNAAFLAALDANENGEIDAGEIPDNAADILQYHVLDDVFFAADVPTAETAITSLEGSDVTVVRSGSNVTINPNADNANVVAPDVEVSNGVIHGIDTVLIPPSN